MEFSLKRLLSFSDCFTPAALALSRFGILDEIGTLAELGTSTLLARWPIDELARLINIPQRHLTKYTHVELEIKTNKTYKSR